MGLILCVLFVDKLFKFFYVQLSNHLLFWVQNASGRFLCPSSFVLWLWNNWGLPQKNFTDLMYDSLLEADSTCVSFPHGYFDLTPEPLLLWGHENILFRVVCHFLHTCDGGVRRTFKKGGTQSISTGRTCEQNKERPNAQTTYFEAALTAKTTLLRSKAKSQSKHYLMFKRMS